MCLGYANQIVMAVEVVEFVDSVGRKTLAQVEHNHCDSTAVDDLDLEGTHYFVGWNLVDFDTHVEEW